MNSPPIFSLPRQRGVTLMELMVGITIGLLVVAVAMGALMISRQVGGTISDSSDIQQQAAYAMRVIGQQMRQANILRLQLYEVTELAEGEKENDSVSPVQLIDESNYPHDITWNIAPRGLEDMERTGTGQTGPRMFFINVDDDTVKLAEEKVWNANCLGDAPGGMVYSHFILEGSELKCASSSSGKLESNDYQPVLRNVAEFQVRYLIYDPVGEGQQKIKYAPAADVHLIEKGWEKVQGMEVCLTLFGNERIAHTEDAIYQSCNGPEQYKDIPAGEQRRDRLHLTFHSIFQLRNQGRPTPPGS